MTPAAILQRKIKLKRQALKLIRAEMEDLIFQCAALKYRDRLAERIGKKFDAELSARLDYVQNLLDYFTGGRPLDLIGSYPSLPATFGVAKDGKEKSY